MSDSAISASEAALLGIPSPQDLGPRCERTDLLAASCAHCTGRDGGERAERELVAALLARPGVVPARYGGRCADCGQGYEAGEPIKHADGYGWVASCCFPEGGTL